MINPNARLLNLFGGTAAPPRKLSGGDSSEAQKDEYNFSESSQEDLRRRRMQDVETDERPFAQMYGINTTVEGAMAKARKLGIQPLAAKYSPSPTRF